MTEITCQDVDSGSRADFDLHFLDLPDIVFEKTLSYLTYDEIARARSVCRKFDYFGKMLLNQGFLAAERFHAQCLKTVKSRLPKRESERRTHPMSRHCDILTAIETRLSLLSMTFTRYVDVKVCCFIPGKVIDEIFRVLHMVMYCNTPPTPHEMLQELRDISSMAMEHFDESVVPRLKQTLVSNANKNLSVATTSNVGILTNAPARSMTLNKARQDYYRIQTRSKHNKKSVDNLKKMLRQLRLKVKRQGVHITRQNQKLTELGQKMSEQDTVIAELKKHLQEWDHVLGHQKTTLLAGIGTPVQETPTFAIKAEVAVPNTSDCVTAASPMQGTSAETSAAEVEYSDAHKGSDCNTLTEISDETSAYDEIGTTSRSSQRPKRGVATKRKMKFEQAEDLSRTRYNPIMDAIRAKNRVCLFFEELQR